MKMSKYTTMGADLVCFGGKYFEAPNSTGLLCGKKELVEAAARHSFVAFETTGYRTFGRPMKLDRQEIIAVVVALRGWLTMDHQARFESYARRVRVLQNELEGLQGIEMTPQGSPATGLRISLDEKALGKTAAQIADALRQEDPRILLRHEVDALTVSAVTIMDGDDLVIADSLKRVLSG